jgi:plasmid maintenance system antidote protein VapI
MAQRQLRDRHLGELLKEEFLVEIGISHNRRARAIGVLGNPIHAIVNSSRDASRPIPICASVDFSGCRKATSFEAKHRIAGQIA